MDKTEGNDLLDRLFGTGPNDQFTKDKLFLARCGRAKRPEDDSDPPYEQYGKVIETANRIADRANELLVEVYSIKGALRELTRAFDLQSEYYQGFVRQVFESIKDVTTLTSGNVEDSVLTALGNLVESYNELTQELDNIEDEVLDEEDSETLLGKRLAALEDGTDYTTKGLDE